MVLRPYGTAMMAKERPRTDNMLRLRGSSDLYPILARASSAAPAGRSPALAGRTLVMESAPMVGWMWWMAGLVSVEGAGWSHVVALMGKLGSE